MNLPVVQTDANTTSLQTRHLLDLSLEELAQWLVEREHKKFRAKQIFGWVFDKRVRDFEQMTDLPKSLRDELAGEFHLLQADESAVQTSQDGTDKLLLRLADGGEVECVLLRDGPRRSICVSSQVGCAMGCVFCASGLDGVERNLTRGEIVEQMLRLQSRLDDGERLSHIVMMGMGEPL
ncbi:MAG: 23S rRNA (adenine(2503)-C(2))-methyltransferase RlmN, partial [Planctomycetota bacterium]